MYLVCIWSTYNLTIYFTIFLIIVSRTGMLNELTHNNYVETLDTASKDVDVLVYIYEDFIASCRRWDSRSNSVPRIILVFDNSKSDSLRH